MSEASGKRGAARALCNLLLGHIGRFRDARLQDLATSTLRSPDQPGWVIPAINATIRARQAVTRVLYLEPRRLASRAAFRWRRLPDPVPRQTISLLCPTRARSGWLTLLLSSIEQTAFDGRRVEVLCYVDSDDPELQRYRDLLAELGHRSFPRLSRVLLHVGDPIGVPRAWNALADQATGDYLLMANDDQLYISYGWDLAIDATAAALEREHPDKIFCLYFDAGQYGDSQPDFPMISRGWYEVLGYFAPVIFQQWSSEKWIFDIARRAECLYAVPRVFVEHRHYQDYKAPFDSTYQLHRLTREKSFSDQALFLRTKGERAEAAAQLLEAMARHHTPDAGRTRSTEGPTTMKDDTGDNGTGVYIEQMVRRFYGNLIDAWNYSGQVDQARACAELAVSQGIWEHPLQRAREYVPGLPAQARHDPSSFWFTALLEERYPQIRAEIEQVLASGTDPVTPNTDDAALIRRGAWEQAHLFRDGQWQESVCKLFPVITAIAQEIPEISTFNPGIITVSRVQPGTHIMPHCGPTNAVLRVHLPISVPPGVSIRVGEEWLEWTEGQCLVFDDSFEHEVRHEGTVERIVLILDFLHPALGNDLRERLRQRRLTFEEQIVAFMRERGVERIATQGEDLVLFPDAATRELAQLYMSGTGIEGAELDGDTVVWHRRLGRA